MAKRRKEVTFVITATIDAKASVAAARRELKERANNSTFDFWDDTNIKVKTVRSVRP